MPQGSQRTRAPEAQPVGRLTSTMMVATRRVGSNILFSCFIGPMRKTVLRGDTHKP